MLQLGHPWVLADAYTRRWPRGKVGDLAFLVSESGEVLATALRDPESRTVARVLAWEPMELTAAWLKDRLIAARHLRLRHAQLDGTDAFRCVNAEGDGLPGLVVDRYSDYLLLQFYCDIWQPHMPMLLKVLNQVFRPQGIYGKERPQNTRVLESQWKDRGDLGQLIDGSAAPTQLVVEENGLQYLVNLKEGLHTGLFLDQRANRRDLMARAEGKTVLNLFSYTGAFSVAAAAAGAKRVTSVDVSPHYMNWAKDNFGLNRLNPKKHDFLVGDAFKILEDLARENRRFDIVLMDPPAFSTTKKNRFSTKGGTARLVEQVLPLMEPGGLLMASCNHQKVSEPDYQKELRRGMLQAGSTLRLIRQGGQGEDFPYPPTFSEGRYLKFAVSVKEA